MSWAVVDSDRTPESETGEVAVGTAPDDYAAIDLEIRELGKFGFCATARPGAITTRSKRRRA